jgi:putative sigma-54 modulation protein
MCTDRPQLRVLLDHLVPGYQLQLGNINQTIKEKDNTIMKDRTNDIIISGHNLNLTVALKRMVIEKVSKLFEHENHIIRVRVELSSDQAVGSPFHAKGMIEIRGKTLVADVASDDLYKSIDLLENKLDRMLRRRSRIRVLKRKHTHDVEIPAAIPKAQSA